MGAAEKIKVTVNGKIAKSWLEGSVLVAAAKAEDNIVFAHKIDTVNIPNCHMTQNLTIIAQVRNGFDFWHRARLLSDFGIRIFFKNQR